MKRVSPYLAAGLFLAAVAAKLLIPSSSGRSVPTSGAAMSDPPAAAETIQAETTAKEPVIVTINAADYLGVDRNKSISSILPEAVERAVETFLDEQAPYEELAVPADVSYDVPSLSFSYVKPVRASVSSSFGYRTHPLENLTRFHYGTDLAALSGDDILCFADGTVSEVGFDETNGNFIRVDHADGVSTMYAHCGLVYVKEGQAVGMGEKIGLVGVSGKVTGPHLHFELTRNGVFLNPEFYLAAL